jgi:hypothetical protein
MVRSNLLAISKDWLTSGFLFGPVFIAVLKGVRQQTTEKH